MSGVGRKGGGIVGRRGNVPGIIPGRSGIGNRGGGICPEGNMGGRGNMGGNGGIIGSTSELESSINTTYRLVYNIYLLYNMIN